MSSKFENDKNKSHIFFFNQCQKCSIGFNVWTLFRLDVFFGEMQHYPLLLLLHLSKVWGLDVSQTIPQKMLRASCLYIVMEL